MLKKILKIVGIVALILLLGLGAIVSCTVYQSAKYDELLLPKIETEIPIVTSWEYESLAPLLSEPARGAFETERGQKILNSFKKLGELDYLETPQFKNVSTEAHSESGTSVNITYTITAHFTSGPALITVVYIEEGEEHKVQYIHIDSDVFLE